MIGGCAPRDDWGVLRSVVDRARVKDASVRRVRGYPTLRFNALLISDLDDAIAAGHRGDGPAMRELAAVTVTAAGDLALRHMAFEWRRLSQPDRARVAERAGCAPDDLGRHFQDRSDVAVDALVDRIRRDPLADVRARLVAIRRGIEPAADDAGRLGRQVLLSWAAIPAWLGVADEERQLPQKTRDKREKTADRVTVYSPPTGDSDDALARFAPLILIEQPPRRDYEPDADRIGRVQLAGTPEAVRVRIDTDAPTVYAYATECKIGGRRRTQFVYAWWFPRRPPMSPRDPVAGPIDGVTLRITLDAAGHPGIYETTLNCGCGHVAFVSERTEARARQAFGRPERDKRLVIEHDVPGKRDLVVVDTVPDGGPGARPLVFVAAGFHEVFRILTGDAVPGGVTATESSEYAMAPYESLGALPLGRGVGSMFGPDGLVQGAGRPEGFLLAPTGMLSAGQQRQRGTRKIRWDAYAFDDPHLLERTLRLPPAF